MTPEDLYLSKNTGGIMLRICCSQHDASGIFIYMRL